MKEIKAQYSGKRSEKIWDIINSLPEHEQRRLYSSFILLQNLESTCLTWLNNQIIARDIGKNDKSEILNIDNKDKKDHFPGINYFKNGGQ